MKLTKEQQLYNKVNDYDRIMLMVQTLANIALFPDGEEDAELARGTLETIGIDLDELPRDNGELGVVCLI